MKNKTLECNCIYTTRNRSKNLEKILYKPIPMLDHELIRTVNYMGNDNSIVQEARVSYGNATKPLHQDKKTNLLSYAK